MRPLAPAPITAARTPSGSGRRLVWADAAKGVCIALVVLHHLTTKHYDLLVPDGTNVEAFWQAMTDALKPVRMPLFFLISGMFAAGAVRRPWRDVARRRVANPYYLYAVWLGLHAAFFSVFTVLPMNRTRSMSELVEDLVFASTGLWYLYALAAYFVLAKVLRSVDHRVVLLAAAAVSASSSLLPIEAANRESLLQHFVFFVVGVLVPDLPRRVAELPGRQVTGALTAGCAALAAAAWLLGLPQSTTTLLVSVVAVPLAIRLVAAACSRPWFSTPAAMLGRQTLPVYVLHVPLISLLHHLVVQLPGAPTLWDAPGGAVLLAVYPLLSTAVITVGCLGLHSALARGGFPVLFRMPGRAVPPRQS